MRKVSSEIIDLCRQYRRSGLSHRDIIKKLKISLGSAFKYSKDIILTKKQHLALKRRNIPKITSQQRKLGGLNSSGKFKPLYTKENLLDFLKDFFRKEGRIPTKREVTSHKPYVRLFGSWNNAIKEAGFNPNPVKFAKKCIANDGHACDSLAEKIIDDWLYIRNIPHETKVPYNKDGVTADFKINGILVEFLGLYGALDKYDMSLLKKEKLWKEKNLKVIKIFPRDLFPKNRLGEILKF